MNAFSMHALGSHLTNNSAVTAIISSRWLLTFLLTHEFKCQMPIQSPHNSTFIPDSHTIPYKQGSHFCMAFGIMFFQLVHRRS